MRLTDLGLAKVILQDPSMRFGRYVMTGGTGCVCERQACAHAAATTDVRLSLVLTRVLPARRRSLKYMGASPRLASRVVPRVPLFFACQCPCPERHLTRRRAQRPRW